MVTDSKYRLSFRSCESLQAGSSSSTAVLGCCSAMHVEVRSSTHSFFYAHSVDPNTDTEPYGYRNSQQIVQ